jgi:hypothetical protein
MKKILILSIFAAYQTILTAQLNSLWHDLSSLNIKSDREFIFSDKEGTTFYLLLQKEDGAFSDGKANMVQVDSTLHHKAMSSDFPRLNALLAYTIDNDGMTFVCKVNKNSDNTKPEGVQLIKSIHFNKNTLEHTEKTLFEINAPEEQIVTFMDKDSIQYLMTFEKQLMEVSFYSFDSEKLHFRKSYKLQGNIEEKKFFERVFNDTVEGGSFSSSANTGKLFLIDSTFHIIVEYLEAQHHLAFDLTKEHFSIEKLPLALISSGSASEFNKITGQLVDNKLFQLHQIDQVFCLGIYDLTTKVRVKTYPYKQWIANPIKNSPFYLDTTAITKSDELKNSKAFFKELSSTLLALEVSDKDDFYYIKMGGINLSEGNNYYPNILFQQQQLQMDRNMQNIIKNAPPPIRSGGFRALHNNELFLISKPANEVYFYLKLKKSDLSFVQGVIDLPKSELDAERKKLFENKIFASPDFKIKGKKGFGYYNESTKKLVLKMEK